MVWRCKWCPAQHFFCRCPVRATPEGRLQALCRATVLQWLSSRCCWCKWGIWVPPWLLTQVKLKDSVVCWLLQSMVTKRSGLCITVAITLGEFRPQLRWKSSRVNTPCCFFGRFRPCPVPISQSFCSIRPRGLLSSVSFAFSEQRCLLQWKARETAHVRQL